MHIFCLRFFNRLYHQPNRSRHATLQQVSFVILFLVLKVEKIAYFSITQNESKSKMHRNEIKLFEEKKWASDCYN